MTAIILVIILMVAAIAYFGFIKRKKGAAATDRTQQLIDSLTVQKVTPLGAFVLSRKELSPEVTEAIDAEFNHMGVLADYLGYKNKTNARDFTVLVFPSERDYDSNGVYCPAFRVYFGPGNAYDESEFDQEPGRPGGWTFAAEEVLDLENCRVVIPESENVQFVRDCVHYFCDHVFRYHNDRELYEATKNHANGANPHPQIT